MASKFKCCKTREHKDWFCLVCKNFIHPSCWKRTNNNYVVITESLIYCSNQCRDQAAAGDYDNAVDDLRKIITELQAEVDEKTRFIKRLKRDSVTFADEAANIESQLASDLEKQNHKIKQLKKKIEDLTQDLRNKNNLINQTTQTPIISMCDLKIQTDNERDFKSQPTQTPVVSTFNVETQVELTLVHSEIEARALDTDIPSSNCFSSEGHEPENVRMDNLLTEICQEKKAEMTKLVNDLQELRASNRSMLTSIETLCAEKELYINELNNLRKEISCYGFDGSKSTDTQDNQRELNGGKHVKSSETCEDQEIINETKLMDKAVKKKILVYGDESARNYSVNLKNFLDARQFDVEGLVLSGAPLGEISKNTFKIASGFGYRDYVIFMLDVNRLSFIKLKEIYNILAVGKFTNLILCCKVDYNIVNMKVYNELNKVCSLFLDHNLNISVKIICNSRCDRGYLFGYLSLCKLLASYICTNGLSQSSIVLKSVPLTDCSDFFGEKPELCDTVNEEVLDISDSGETDKVFLDQSVNLEECP